MHRPSVSPPPLSLQPGAQRHKNSASPFPTSRHQMLGLKRTSEPFCQASLCLNQNAPVKQQAQTQCPLSSGNKNLKLEQGSCFPWDLTHHLFFPYALLIPKTKLPKLWSLTKPSLLLWELGLQYQVIHFCLCSSCLRWLSQRAMNSVVYKAKHQNLLPLES